MTMTRLATVNSDSVGDARFQTPLLTVFDVVCIISHHNALLTLCLFEHEKPNKETERRQCKVANPTSAAHYKITPTEPQHTCRKHMHTTCW